MKFVNGAIIIYLFPVVFCLCFSEIKLTLPIFFSLDHLNTDSWDLFSNIWIYFFSDLNWNIFHPPASHKLELGSVFWTQLKCKMESYICWHNPFLRMWDWIITKSFPSWMFEQIQISLSEYRSETFSSIVSLST